MLASQIPLDVLPNGLPRSRQLTRDSGLMLAQKAACLSEGQVFAIVAGQPQTIAIRQCRETVQQRLGDEDAKTARVRIDRRRTDRHRRRRPLIVQRGEPALRSNPVNVTLREDGAQPRGEAAAAMKVAEERSALTVSLLQAEEIGIERIGMLARAAARIERARGAIQHRTKDDDEMVPCGVDTFGTRTGEGEIVEVEAAAVTLDGSGIGSGVRKRFGGAALERGREHGLAHAPLRGLGLLIQARQDVVTQHSQIVPCADGLIV